MKLTLVTPYKKLFTDREIEEIFVPGFRGELNILDMHAPLVTTLLTGELKFRFKGEAELQVAAISWGFCEVCEDNISVLAETAELPQEIDVDRARKALKMAQQKLSEPDLTPEEAEKNYQKEKRAEVRIKVALMKKQQTQI